MASTTDEQTGNFSLPSTFGGAHPGKSVLKEAVDAVLNSFAKHTHGYGRGKFTVCYIIPNATNEPNGSYDKVFEQKSAHLTFVSLFALLLSATMTFKFSTWW